MLVVVDAHEVAHDLEALDAQLAGARADAGQQRTPDQLDLVLDDFRGLEGERLGHLECLELHVLEGVHQQCAHVVHDWLHERPDQFVFDP